MAVPVCLPPVQKQADATLHVICYWTVTHTCVRLSVFLAWAAEVIRVSVHVAPCRSSPQIAAQLHGTVVAACSSVTASLVITAFLGMTASLMLVLMMAWLGRWWARSRWKRQHMQVVLMLVQG